MGGRDLTGQRFGSRVVLRRLPSVSYGHNSHSRWAVRCDCGRESVTVRQSVLRAVSCGACQRARMARERGARA
jgi:hypothetical protein